MSMKKRRQTDIFLELSAWIAEFDSITKSLNSGINKCFGLTWARIRASLWHRSLCWESSFEKAQVSISEEFKVPTYQELMVKPITEASHGDTKYPFTVPVLDLGT